jgi:single-stranded-DNA-specific exonuclease
MKTHPVRWLIHPPVPPSVQRDLSLFPAVIQQLLFNRGINTHDEAKMFLEARLPDEVQDSQLLGLKEASLRLHKALNANEHIAIYGDFDVDGITSAAMLKSAFLTCNDTVSTYIPHRVDEGYGLNMEAIRGLHKRGADLLLSVDCGIRAVKEVAIAKELGLDVIITDHHQPGGSLPDADIIINPNQPRDPYPNKDLAGVGVAYKLLESMGRYFPNIRPEGYLDLVALGTIADLVPLIGENRFLARQGLSQLRRPQRQGVLALMGVAGVDPQTIQASDISFQLAPRLNAAGRLSSANFALELLLEEDVYRAGRIAQEIEILNIRRKDLMHEVKSKAEAIAIPEEKIPPILFAFHPDFNQGIVGLAAGHLSEKYFRPAIVGKRDEEITTASCRSIDGFNIIHALDQHKDLFLNYGGHPSAAGFTILNENIPALKDQLTHFSRKAFEKIDLTPTLYADMEISLHDLTRDLLGEIQGFSPMGVGNPQACFLTTGLTVKSCRQVGKQYNHLKLAISDGSDTFDAIAFRLGHMYETLPPKIDILYTFEENIFRGHSSLQLNIKDIRASDRI